MILGVFGIHQEGKTWYTKIMTIHQFYKIWDNLKVLNNSFLITVISKDLLKQMLIIKYAVSDKMQDPPGKTTLKEVY